MATTVQRDRRPRRRPRPVPPPTIVQPGRNCWRVARAERFRAVQDAAEYFRLVRQAILEAEQSVFIVGWDILAALDLIPDPSVVAGPALDAPSRLDELLAFAVRRRPDLRCYILIWDYAALYTLERDPLARWRLGSRHVRQVRFGFDDHHPVGGSHHQKIVIVDDALAFCGGIDLTGHRWDTTAHRLEEPARTNAIGTAYGPYHEVQAMMSGPAAAALGALVRERWRALGEEPRPSRAAAPAERWPAEIAADLADVDVAIARTAPASERSGEVRECERLFFDSIAAARHTIYLESQYFTHEGVGQALAERLRERDGPEVIVVVPRQCEGWLERQKMGALREQVCRQLVDADRHGRLRLVYPAASQPRDVPTFVHSKVTIVDDRFVRIGSANVSRRSMGVDTECDVAVEVAAEARQRAGIRRIRARLLGEHLGLSDRTVARELRRLGSIRALIDARAGNDRTLVRVPVAEHPEPVSAVLHTAADPEAPVQLGPSMAELIPPLDARADRGVVRTWLPALVIVPIIGVWTTLVGVAGVAGPWTLLDGVANVPARVAAGVGAFVALHFLLMPMELLAVLAGLLLGGWTGSIVAVLGAWTAALLGYALGRTLGPADLGRWMSRRAYRSARQLGARGVVGVAILRLTSIASGTSLHLICGSARVPLRAYVAGSALGITPVVVVLAGLGGLGHAAVVHGGTARWLAAAAATVVIFVAALALRTSLLLRQFAPTVARHRAGAEFG
jgi:phosphatidylserine/phosphatidylglycerophosphate/cardiolipin synthase-like enzyme/uncharacterized membrane protein YdjX (TVP38/TMEM64 family)